MIIFKYLFFLFVSSIHLLVAEEEEESRFDDIFNQEEQVQDTIENSIHKRNNFIFFKPFKCRKFYFSIVNEVLFMNGLKAFNGYMSHFIYDMKILGPYIVLLEQILIFINIGISIFGFIKLDLWLRSLKYILEIVKVIIPKVDFLLGYYGNFKFFYHINYDFGMRMRSVSKEKCVLCKKKILMMRKNVIYVFVLYKEEIIIAMIMIMVAVIIFFIKNV